MGTHRIRPLAICIFLHDGRILAAEGYDPTKDQTFYRPLGGAIEFGERSEETIIRELQEELGAAVTRLVYLGTLENIFTFDGRLGHEIVQVYDGSFVDEQLYVRPELQGIEEGEGPFRAVWLTLETLGEDASPPLYPDGLLELLLKLDGEQGA